MRGRAQRVDQRVAEDPSLRREPLEILGHVADTGTGIDHVPESTHETLDAVDGQVD
jgi:hypothetical protein